MSLTSRHYSGHDDLRLMIELEQAIMSARWPLLPPWHCGDLVWNAYTVDPGSDRALLWFEGDDLAAFALLPGPEEWHLALRPGRRDEARIYAEGSAWAEEVLRPAAGEPVTLSMPVLDSDPARAAALEALEYRRKGPSGTRMRRSLGVAIGEPLLPSSMKLDDCVAADSAERVEAHRDAWGHLEHIGIPDARSSFSVERYQRLRATPGYEPRLDLVVTTEAGQIAACCICWVDDRNGIGLFEPVGTRFEYRRRGLARALVLEGQAVAQARPAQRDHRHSQLQSPRRSGVPVLRLRDRGPGDRLREGTGPRGEVAARDRGTGLKAGPSPFDGPEGSSLRWRVPLTAS